MRMLEQIFKNEPVEDVITVFALNSSVASLDVMFGQYNPDAKKDGVFLKEYARLFEEGVLSRGDDGTVVKGSKWKEPKFLSDSKYLGGS